MKRFLVVSLLLLIPVFSTATAQTDAASKAILLIREAEKATPDSSARAALRKVREQLEDIEDQSSSEAGQRVMTSAAEELRAMNLEGDAGRRITEAIGFLEPPPAATAKVDTGEGLHTVQFDTLQGTVTVTLPDDMQGGDTISGSVVANPKGNNPAEQAKNGDSLSGVVVEIDKQQAPASNGGGKWVLPTLTAAAGFIPVILRDRGGHEIGRASVPLQPPTGASPESPAKPDLTHATTSSGYQTPATGQAGHPATVRGDFDGDFTTTHVSIGGAPTRVLAESPRKAVFESPSSAVGATDIEITKGDHTVKCQYRSLAVKLAAPKVNLKSGERTVMTVSVEGAEGLDAPVSVEVWNHTPGVVHIDKGDRQTVVFDAHASQPGMFVATRQLTGVMPGGFNITAVVLPPKVAMQPCGAAPAQAANTLQPNTPLRPGTQQRPTGVTPVTNLPSSIRPRIPNLPEGPDDPEELRSAAIAVHTGSQWRDLTGGRNVLVYRDNPPIAGRVDLAGGVVTTEPPLEDHRTSYWLRNSTYFTFMNADIRIDGSQGVTWNDADNSDGYLGVGRAGAAGTGDFVFHTNGLLLNPGTPVDLSLQRRTGVGEAYSRRWPWQNIENANGTVTLAPNTRLVAVTAIVVTEPGQTGSIGIDEARANLWFDGRTIGRKPQYTSNNSMATLVLDRDPRPDWSPANFDDPDQGRPGTTLQQNVDEIWAYCGTHYDRNIQFRLIRYAEISSDVSPVCTRMASEGRSRDLYTCIAAWARHVRDTTGDTRPSVPIVFVRQYPTRGVAETVNSGIIVSNDALSGYGTNTVGHELGHFLGGPIEIFRDGSNSGTNLMHMWNGPSGGITLTREQCQTAWENAANYTVR